MFLHILVSRPFLSACIKLSKLPLAELGTEPGIPAMLAPILILFELVITWWKWKAMDSSADISFFSRLQFCLFNSLEPAHQAVSTCSYVLWVWVFPAALWLRYSQARNGAVLHSAMPKFLMIPVAHILNWWWECICTCLRDPRVDRP